MSQQQLKLSILIVTYNSGHVVHSALQPLVGHPNIEIVVVDNDSTDDTIQVIRNLSTTTRVVLAGANLGFARAVNRAAGVASGDILILLNPDASITAADAQRLGEILTSDDRSGIVGPLIVTEGRPRAMLAAGRAPTIWRMLMHASGLSRLSWVLPPFEGHYLTPRNVPASIRDVDWVSGGCLAISRALWDEVGGLSERWFMYAEDIDLCLRVKDVGRSVKLTSRVRAEHAVGSSSAGVDGKYGTLWLENLFELYCLRYAPGTIRRGIWRRAVSLGYRARSEGAAIAAVLLRGRKAEMIEHRLRFERYANALSRRRLIDLYSPVRQSLRNKR